MRIMTNDYINGAARLHDSRLDEAGHVGEGGFLRGVGEECEGFADHVDKVPKRSGIGSYPINKDVDKAIGKGRFAAEFTGCNGRGYGITDTIGAAYRSTGYERWRLGVGGSCGGK